MEIPVYDYNNKSFPNMEEMLAYHHISPEEFVKRTNRGMFPTLALMPLEELTKNSLRQPSLMADIDIKFQSNFLNAPGLCQIYIMEFIDSHYKYIGQTGQKNNCNDSNSRLRRHYTDKDYYSRHIDKVTSIVVDPHYADLVEQIGIEEGSPWVLNGRNQLTDYSQYDPTVVEQLRQQLEALFYKLSKFEHIPEEKRRLNILGMETPIYQCQAQYGGSSDAPSVVFSPVGNRDKLFSNNHGWVTLADGKAPSIAPRAIAPVPKKQNDVERLLTKIENSHKNQPGVYVRHDGFVLALHLQQSVSFLPEDIFEASVGEIRDQINNSALAQEFEKYVARKRLQNSDQVFDFGVATYRRHFNRLAQIFNVPLSIGNFTTYCRHLHGRKMPQLASRRRRNRSRIITKANPVVYQDEKVTKLLSVDKDNPVQFQVSTHLYPLLKKFSWQARFQDGKLIYVFTHLPTKTGEGSMGVITLKKAVALIESQGRADGYTVRQVDGNPYNFCSENLQITDKKSSDSAKYSSVDFLSILDESKPATLWNYAV